MQGRYSIANPDEVLSPGLVVFEEIVRENVARMLEIAGDRARLRPHCKTHKMIDVTRLEVGMGIFKHKCATFAEAEMLALGGARDVFLAYNLVGPNLARAVRYRKRFPDVRLAVAADHPDPVESLNDAMSRAGERVHVFVDIDTGLRRTGLAPGPEARDLYARVNESSHLTAAGLHLYDGQNHQTDLGERQSAVDRCWDEVLALRARLAASSLPVPSIVAGGTGTFPLHARRREPGLELSPGTCVFHDAGYAREFPEMRFEAAAPHPHPGHQPAGAEPRDLRPRLQGLRIRPAGRKPAALSRHSRRAGGAAERRAPRARDRAGRPLSAGRRRDGDPDPHLPDLRPAFPCVGRGRGTGREAMGGHPPATARSPCRRPKRQPRMQRRASPVARRPGTGQRIWLRNSWVRGSFASVKKVAGGPCSTMTPRSVK